MLSLTHSLESVQQIQSPLGLVLVEGAKKPPYLTPFDAKPCLQWAVLEAWRAGSKEASMQSSFSLHWHQKATVATAHTAVLNVLDKQR